MLFLVLWFFAFSLDGITSYICSLFLYVFFICCFFNFMVYVCCSLVFIDLFMWLFNLLVCPCIVLVVRRYLLLFLCLFIYCFVLSFLRSPFLDFYPSFCLCLHLLLMDPMSVLVLWVCWLSTFSGLGSRGTSGLGFRFLHRMTRPSLQGQLPGWFPSIFKHQAGSFSSQWRSRFCTWFSQRLWGATVATGRSAYTQWSP